MQDILTYVIIFGLLIVFTYVFLSNKEKTKQFVLSQKDYSFGSLKVLVEKQNKEIKSLIVNPYIKQGNETVLDITAEVTLKNKETLVIDLAGNIIETEAGISIPFTKFTEMFQEMTNKLEYFKIVITFASNKKLKSGNLAFNKKWSIYTPDTGKYN